jgi:hypothetical protein
MVVAAAVTSPMLQPAFQALQPSSDARIAMPLLFLRVARKSSAGGPSECLKNTVRCFSCVGAPTWRIYFRHGCCEDRCHHGTSRRTLSFCSMFAPPKPLAHPRANYPLRSTQSTRPEHLSLFERTAPTLFGSLVRRLLLAMKSLQTNAQAARRQS